MQDTNSLLRPELAALAPYNAGLTTEEVAARPGVSRVAKLGFNEYPLGPSPAVQTAMAESLGRVHIYPDPAGRALCNDLALANGCAPWQVVLGNGSEDLLSILARAMLRPRDRVVTLYPSFPLHEDYAHLMGAQVERVGLTSQGRIDVEALIEAVSQPVRLVVFANPMNPAGVWLTPEDLRAVLDAVHPNALTCLDEAYVEYAEGSDFASGASLLATHDKPLLVLRTFPRPGYSRLCASAAA